MKLTERQWRQLENLAALEPDLVWLVEGQSRFACGRLERLGLARSVGGDGSLGEAFVITDAGRRALEERS